MLFMQKERESFFYDHPTFPHFNLWHFYYSRWKDVRQELPCYPEGKFTADNYALILYILVFVKIYSEKDGFRIFQKKLGFLFSHSLNSFYKSHTSR